MLFELYFIIIVLCYIYIFCIVKEKSIKNHSISEYISESLICVSSSIILHLYDWEMCVVGAEQHAARRVEGGGCLLDDGGELAPCGEIPPGHGASQHPLRVEEAGHLFRFRIRILFSIHDELHLSGGTPVVPLTGRLETTTQETRAVLPLVHLCSALFKGALQIRFPA